MCCVQYTRVPNNYNTFLRTCFAPSEAKLQKSGSFNRCSPVLQLRTFQSVCLLPPGNSMWAAAWLHLWRQVWRLVARRHRNRTGWRSTTLRWPSPDARAFQDPQVNARFVAAMVLVLLVYWLNNLFQRWQTYVRTYMRFMYVSYRSAPPTLAQPAAWSQEFNDFIAR